MESGGGDGGRVDKGRGGEVEGGFGLGEAGSGHTFRVTEKPLGCTYPTGYNKVYQDKDYAFICLR